MCLHVTVIGSQCCEALVKKHLKHWRLVKKNPKLSSSPSFWAICAGRKLLLPRMVTKSPRIRNMLDAHAACGNLFTKNCVLDVSQTVDRVALRTNGDMLTLTRTCGSIFAPLFGTTLSPAQCFALQGCLSDRPASSRHIMFNE